MDEADGELPAIDLEGVARARRPPALAAPLVGGLGTVGLVVLALIGLKSWPDMNWAPLAMGAMYGWVPLLVAYLNLRQKELVVRPDATTARLHAHDGALFLGSEPLCKREDVTNATLSMSDRGPLARIELRRGPPIELFVRSLDDGKTLLGALGADVKHRSDSVTGPSALPSGSWVIALGIALVGVFLMGVIPDKQFLPHQVAIGAAMVPFALACMIPAFIRTKITVGVEGIELRWLWRRRFIPLKDIASVERLQGGLRVHKLTGRHEDIIIKRNTFLPDLEAPRVVERLNEAIEAHRTASAPVVDPTLLERGETAITQWIERLRGVTQLATFRQAGLVAEELFQIVENAALPPARRAAAAVALSPSLDDGGKARLRIAADASALPHLRVALDAAAADDQATLESALAEVVEEHRDGV